MSTKKIFTAALLCLLFSACKKKEDNPIDTAENLASLVTIQNKGAEVYCATLSATHDSVAAINALGQWLLDQPDVKEAYYWSTAMVEIHYKNGLQSHIVFVKTDDNNRDLQRGDGGGGILKRFNATDKEKIRNNKVLVLNPFLKEFYGATYPKLPQFEGGPQAMDVKVLSENQVTYNVLSTLDQYGLVILNTHGVPNGFMLSRLFNIPVGDSIMKWNRDSVLLALSTQGNFPLEKFESNELILDMLVRVKNYEPKDKGFVVLVGEKYIRNSGLNMEKTVVFGNHCHSGYTLSGPTVNNMSQAWRSRGTSAYYGYAFPSGSSSLVYETFATRMEDTLIRSLVIYGDTTGIAHLANNTTVLFDPATFPNDPEDLEILINRGMMFQPMGGTPNELGFKHFFDDNYAFGCGDTITDSRDGQKYPTVCIGEQVWMAKNLNWAGAGSCYLELGTHCDTYGRLYTWNEVMNGAASTTASPSGVQGICPQGWHVPSLAEWNKLITFIGGAAVAGGKLKSTSNLWLSPNTGATDNYGFSALPGGRMDSGFPSFPPEYTNKTYYARIWSATEYGNQLAGYEEYSNLDLSHDGATATMNSKLGVDKLSCRCVRDSL